MERHVCKAALILASLIRTNCIRLRKWLKDITAGSMISPRKSEKLKQIGLVTIKMTGISLRLVRTAQAHSDADKRWFFFFGWGCQSISCAYIAKLLSKLRQKWHLLPVKCVQWANEARAAKLIVSVLSWARSLFSIWINPPNKSQFKEEDLSSPDNLYNNSKNSL